MSLLEWAIIFLINTTDYNFSFALNGCDSWKIRIHKGFYNNESHKNVSHFKKITLCLISNEHFWRQSAGHIITVTEMFITSATQVIKTN